MTDPLQQPSQITSSHLAYTDLADYADQQGAPESAAIQCGVSHAFHNKSLKPGHTKAAFGNSFIPSAITFPLLVEHILSGGAYTPGYFNSISRRTDTFRSSHMLVLDLDDHTSVQDVLETPFIARYAALVHPSASSSVECHKTRVVFVLDQPVIGSAAYRALAAGVCQYVGLDVDPASIIPAQPFFGSTNRIEQPYINLNARLPLLIAGGLCEPMARVEMENDLERQSRPAPRPIDPGCTRAQGYTDAMLDNETREYLAVPAGAKLRHNAFVSLCANLIGKDKGGWPIQGVDGLLTALGQQTDREDREIRGAIQWAWKNAESRPLELPDRPRTVQSTTNKHQKMRRPSHQRDIDTANIRIDSTPETIPVRYVSDDLTPDAIAATRTLLIQAPTGTGKTHAIVAYANALPNDTQLTGIAQFRLLTQSLRHTIHNSSHYSDSNGLYQHALSHEPRLVSSVSSLYKFNRQGGLVIVDEIEGVLQFVLNSRTFSDDGAAQAYRAFQNLIQGADQVIGMDANLSDITTEWIRGLRGEFLVKRYRRTDRRGKVTFLSSPYATIQKIGKLLAKQQGTVYVPCSSEETASQVTDWYMEQGYKVMKITTDTSNTPAVRDFIQSPEKRQGYDLVVYTAAMGAGVDIAEPVYAVVGLFTLSPLAPGDAIQLFGRVRNAKHYFAAVPNTVDGYATPNVDELLADRLLREHDTARRLTRPSAAGGEQLEMLRLWAQFEERRRRETARWRHYFAARLKANGYTVAANNAKPSRSFATEWSTWLETRNETGWQTILAALGQALPDGDLDKLKLAGHEITRDLKLRNTRYKIEQALHHEDVTDQDRDLVKPLGRNRLFRLADLVSESAELLAADAQEDDEGVPLAQRQYRHFDHEVIGQLFSMVGLNESPEEQFLAFAAFFLEKQTATTVSDRFAAFDTPEALLLFQALGHRGNNARTVTGLCRWLLNYFGISPHSQQIGRGPDRQMTYWIDAEHLAYRLERARTRMRCSARHRTKNVQSQNHKHIFSTAPNTSSHHRPTTVCVRPVSAHNLVLEITDG